ncbi:MAG TPA: hypothetical protein VNQ74_09375 [Burkholderiaceae bacterium]|jgi:hypothetical protein|nr:hypothetical protein [Burkholderiaceae bacterium]
MLSLLGGIIAFVVTAAIFWACLPRDGKRYRLADTAWDAYVGVAFSAGFALSVMAIAFGVVGFIG